MRMGKRNLFRVYSRDLKTGRPVRNFVIEKKGRLRVWSDLGLLSWGHGKAVGSLLVQVVASYVIG